MKAIIFCCLLSAWVTSATALSCLPCEETVCEPMPCVGGMVKDVCGCCDVCAKQVGEACDGLWGLSGTCDEGLYCYRDPAIIHEEGVCKSDVCEWPKVDNPCPTYCPRTCDNRNENIICAAACGTDICECPTGYVLRSLENRTCVVEEECESMDQMSCASHCSSLDLTSTSCEYTRAWICEFRNWRCATHAWKVVAEEWWTASACSDADFEARWAELFACETESPIQCINSTNLTCDSDAFSCPLCHCLDGKYTDLNQLMKIWKIHQEKFMRSKELYMEARSICGDGDTSC